MKRNQVAVLAVLAALVIVGSVIVGLMITSTAGGPAKKRGHAREAATGTPAPTPPSRTTPARTGTTTTATDQVDESEPPAPPGEGDARLVVQRFLHAFTSYEVGAISPQVRRELLVTSSPAVAASLLGRPPRPVHGARPAPGASIASLAATATGRGGAIDYLVDLNRGGTRESFSLTVAPASGKWQVQRLNGA